jgi:hypothetical protein
LRVAAYEVPAPKVTQYLQLDGGAEARDTDAVVFPLPVSRLNPGRDVAVRCGRLQQDPATPEHLTPDDI